MENGKITVHWYCGCYSSPPGFFDEPEDCEGECETEEDLQDWEDEICSCECPNCGQTLYQIDQHAIRIENEA